MDRQAERVVFIFVTAMVLSLATPAAAIDGEVLIDQAKALQGGITPGDGAGYPVLITQGGRFKLTGNLVVPKNTTGIEVHKRDVTIDLNGYSITGSGSLGKGIVSTTESVTVMNGTIRGFGNAGVYLPLAYSVVENMRIVHNRLGVQLGDQGRLLRSTISDTSNGAGLICGANCLVEGNIVQSTNGNGIFLTSGTVLGNTISNNSAYGIDSNGFVGFGNNTIYGGTGTVNTSTVKPLHPNVCDQAC